MSHAVYRTYTEMAQDKAPPFILALGLALCATVATVASMVWPWQPVLVFSELGIVFLLGVWWWLFWNPERKLWMIINFILVTPLWMLVPAFTMLALAPGTTHH